MEGRRGKGINFIFVAPAIVNKFEENKNFMGEMIELEGL